MMLFSAQRRREREAAELLYAAASPLPGIRPCMRSWASPIPCRGGSKCWRCISFALIHRLMHDPGDDPELARRVSERFVADMDGAFREMGVADLTVPKRMMTLYRSFGGRVSAYKLGFEGGEESLAAAIARNVFPDGGRAGVHVALAAYLRSAAAALRAADLQDLRAVAMRNVPGAASEQGARAMKGEPLSVSISAGEISPGGRHIRIEADAKRGSTSRASWAFQALKRFRPNLTYVRRTAADDRPGQGGGDGRPGRRSDARAGDPDGGGGYRSDVVPAEDAAPPPKEKEFSAETDEPDFYRNSRIDLGGIVAEHVALGLDPYPRAPGVEFAGHVETTRRSRHRLSRAWQRSESVANSRRTP